MKIRTVLVTGSSGLIGSEAVEHLDRQGHHVIGVDNNMRRVFFGAPGDTTWNLERLKGAAKNFTHANLDSAIAQPWKSYSARATSTSSCTVPRSLRMTRRAIFRCSISK